MYHMNPQYVSWRTVVQVVFELQEMNRGQKFTYEVGQYYIIQKVVLSEVSLLCALVFYLFEKPNPQWVFTGGFTATGLAKERACLRWTCFHRHTKLERTMDGGILELGVWLGVWRGMMSQSPT